MIKILLVDDYPIFREGVKRVLEGAGDMAVTGEAGSAAEALEKARLLRPDVVVLDLSKPGQQGLDAVRELRARNPLMHVLMLTSHAEDHFAVCCLKQGVDGYLLKDAAPRELIAAIRKVHCGGKYLTPTLVEQLVYELNWAEPNAEDPHIGLSRRQLEVLRLIGSGLTTSAIGALLHLSVKTISTHRVRILEKMHMSNSAQMMRYAVEHDLGS
jgi:two-component system, NarL family, invasion response regulator UvrY